MSTGIQALLIICGTIIAFIWIVAWYSTKENNKKIKNNHKTSKEEVILNGKTLLKSKRIN